MIYLVAVSIQVLCIFIFSLFGFHRLWLLWIYFRKKRKEKPVQNTYVEKYPIVTIQLPIYNEKYVVGRLIEAVCHIDYPLEYLEIQVLDDSIDETQQIVKQVVDEKRKDGFDIKAIKRAERKGYKAGALQEGLQQCRGELVLIFDADFIPPPDILHKAVSYFNDPSIGMVQFPWAHINRNYSLLTWTQAVMLDGHFNIEHYARSRSGRFFNFNGTAGIWRKQCILDAGGWQGDTLTEDFDLSYRAQLKGWQFIFEPNRPIPAELPVEINAFKSQQYRWAKGSVQTAIKLIPELFASSIPFKLKLEGLFHMTANITYLVMPIFILTLPLLVVCDACLPQYLHILSFIGACLSIVFFYLIAQADYFKANILKNIVVIPMLMAVSIGLSINNTRAILSALFARKSDFIRTPKYNIFSRKDTWKHHSKYRVKSTLYPFFELFFVGYLLWIFRLSFLHQAYYLMPFLALFVFGFSYFAMLTLRQTSMS